MVAWVLRLELRSRDHEPNWGKGDEQNNKDEKGLVPNCGTDPDLK